jgi:hypothetical protein
LVTILLLKNNKNRKDKLEKRKRKKKEDTIVFGCDIKRQNDCLCILFSYDEQDKIKYEKIYFIFNMYCCQTYIF